MDRQDSGGMAPALQSSNLQSTDLLNQECEATGVKDVPHAKVNGNTYSDHQILRDASVTTAKSSTSVVKAAGDASLSSSDLNMIVTESCILNSLKEALPAVSTAELHLGQGDGVANHNGWGDCKKPLGGVLQENNLTCNNNSSYVGEKLKKSKKTIHGDLLPIKTDTIENEHLNKVEHKIQPNGKINDLSSAKISSSVSRTRIETASLVSSVANTTTYSTAVSANTSLTFSTAATSLENSCNSMLHVDSNGSSLVSEQCNEEARIIKTSSVDSTASLKMNGSCSNRLGSESSTISNENLLKENEDNVAFISEEIQPQLAASESDISMMPESVPHLPEALQYTDLLGSDLSKINMSDKLANTLQELAASLKGSSLLQLATDSLNDKLCDSITANNNHTVITGSQDTLHRSVKSLDFSSEESRSTERRNELVVNEHKERIKKKIKSAIGGSKLLNNKLQILLARLNSRRFIDIQKHIRRDIAGIASHAQSVTDSGFHRWESENVNITELNLTVPAECTSKSQELWQKIFENSQACNNRRLENGNKSFSKQSVKLTEGGTLPVSPTLLSVKKEFVIDDQKVSSDIVGINLDPIVQLIRMEQSSTSLDNKLDLLNKAKYSAGILKKELKFAHSRCDHELTDSSSDEELFEDSKFEKSTKYVKNMKEMRPSKKYRKSFCKWVAERAEISRKWTWLQSRISTLEFSIRQEGGLYTELRNSKGAVQLEVPTPDSGVSVNPSLSLNEQTTPVNFMPSDRRLSSTDTSYTNRLSEATPPGNVNQLLNNVHHQSARLFDNLSPLSGGSPSPNQPTAKSELKSEAKVLGNKSVQATSTEGTSARTNHLCRSTFNNRKLIKLSSTNNDSNKNLKPRTVPNDSSIMCIGKRTPYYPMDYSASFALKAAQHDHSYHTVISTKADVPLSISMRAVMKSKRKWCQRAESHKHSGSIKSVRKESRHKGKKESRSAQKRKGRSYNMLPPNNFDESFDGKKRKFSNNSSSKKRPRGASFDSDVEPAAIVGGSYSHQSSRGSTNSGANTPTEMTTHNQNYWKKKKSSEHSFDINNIVIPHGLTSARIEKLPYKEIQTPSWKVVALSAVKEDVEKMDSHIDLSCEDMSSLAFQHRHDHYEILEKRKYMAYVEWSMSRKSRGSRMSNLLGPSTTEPTSPTSSFLGEGFSVQTSGAASFTATPNLSHDGKPGGVVTRRMSTDHNPARPVTPLSDLQNQQSNNDTSLSTSYPTPDFSSWQDGLGSRHSSQDATASVNRTLSEGANSEKNHSLLVETWKVRNFPLVDEEIRLLNDIEFAIQKMKNENRSNSYHMEDDFDNYSKRCFVGRHSGGEKNSQHIPVAHTVRSYSQEVVRSDLHHFKPGSMRRRTDSRASSLASHDDTGRYSDASSTSVSSTANRKKKGRNSQGFSSMRRNEFASGKVLQKNARLSRTLQSKHSYLHKRLSETDDSLSDFDSDSVSSDGTTTSFDDAGHIVDDFADPEWEQNTIKQKDRR